ncbi:MAG: hypothetical protein J7M25_12065 [Deltaproteobacteria bacterium]|nr:hypothetical protein [Deltaproteobacteria bacterium]
MERTATTCEAQATKSASSREFFARLTWVLLLVPALALALAPEIGCHDTQVVAEGDGGGLACGPGTHEQGGQCMPDSVTGDGGTSLSCGPGTHEENGACVPDRARPNDCDNVDCGAHGTCKLSDFGKAYCDCDDGYHSENMTCVATCAVQLDELSLTDIGPHGPLQQGALIVDQDVAYLLGAHVWFMDISDPSHPSALYQADSDWHGGPGDAILKDNYLFMMGSHWLDGDPDGLVVYDVSDPSSPRKVGDFGTYMGWDMAIKGNLLLLALTGSVVIMDIADPENPTEISRVKSTPLGATIEVVGNYLWITSAANPPQGWAIVDISDPHNPAVVNHLGPPPNYQALGVSSGTGYAAYMNSVMTLDLADPVHPVILGSVAFNDPDQNGGVSPDAIAFLDDLAVISITGIHVADVSDPVHPMEVASYNSPGQSRIEGALAVRQDGLIVSYYQSGGLSIVQMTCK